MLLLRFRRLLRSLDSFYPGNDLPTRQNQAGLRNQEAVGAASKKTGVTTQTAQFGDDSRDAASAAAWYFIPVRQSAEAVIIFNKTKIVQVENEGVSLFDPQTLSQPRLNSQTEALSAV